MKSLPAIVLLVVLTVPGCVPCTQGEDCIKIGRFCHLGSWNNCCCPFECLGKYVGLCLKIWKQVHGNMTYTIKDANDKQLLHETVALDGKAVVSQGQLDSLVARFGDQPLYLDADVHYYGDCASMEDSSHQSVQRLKIN